MNKNRDSSYQWAGAGFEPQDKRKINCSNGVFITVACQNRKFWSSKDVFFWFPACVVVGFVVGFAIAMKIEEVESFR